MQKRRMSNNRTNSAIRNLVVGAAGKIVLLGGAFLVRTLFIRILGVEYTGISSLYTNILSFLNLAELGMGSVFLYELYGPLQKKDEETVSAYVALFQKIYLVIICAVLGVGLGLLPFLQVITNSSLDKAHLIVYYLLYLADSVSSYFVVYRTTVIEADQRRYITQSIDIGTKLVMYLCQCFYLVVYRDFVGYLCIQVAFTIIKNIILHIVATRLYPYLRRKPTSRLSPEKVRLVFKNVKATFITRIANVVLTQTDSIIISTFLGVVAVGYYTNYNMIVVYINSINSIIYSSVEASVGNLNAEHDSEKSYRMYKRLSLAFALFTAFCTTGYLCTVQDFIVLWIGENFRQGMMLVVAILLTLYMNLSMNAVLMYRQTLGLFKEVQRIYLIMALMNIVISIVLVKWIGVAGVPLGTAISRLLTTFWGEGAVVFKKIDRPYREYIRQQFGFAFFTTATCIFSYCICQKISASGVLALLIDGGLSIVVVIVFAWIIYGRTAEWAWMTDMVKYRIKSSNDSRCT